MSNAKFYGIILIYQQQNINVKHSLHLVDDNKRYDMIYDMIQQIYDNIKLCI